MDEVKNQLVKDVAELKQQVAGLQEQLELRASQGHTHPSAEAAPVASPPAPARLKPRPATRR